MHTQICNIYLYSTATMIRERTSLLRYSNCIIDVSNLYSLVFVAVTIEHDKLRKRKSDFNVFIINLKFSVISETAIFSQRLFTLRGL